jgi:hypothetical protein
MPRLPRVPGIDRRQLTRECVPCLGGRSWSETAWAWFRVSYGWKHSHWRI